SRCVGDGDPGRRLPRYNPEDHANGVQANRCVVLELAVTRRNILLETCWHRGRDVGLTRYRMKLAGVVITAVLSYSIGGAAPADAPQQEVWTFDRLEKIGGHPTTVLGHPRVIDTPGGKAVEFNGEDDGLQIDVHPLAGAETYTWEAIFRPDGGNAEQRWFHLEQNPATGDDADSRMLF